MIGRLQSFAVAGAQKCYIPEQGCSATVRDLWFQCKQLQSNNSNTEFPIEREAHNIAAPSAIKR